MSKKTIGSVMLLLAAVFWGLSYVVQYLIGDLGSFTVVFFKSVGGVLIIPLALLNKERFTAKTIKGGVMIGVICFLGTIFQQKGIEMSSAANASFITSLYIVLVPVMGIFIGKKTATKTWLGVLVAIVGMYLLCISGSLVIRVGDLMLLAGALCFALQIIVIDKYIADVDAMAFTAVQQVTSASLASIAMLAIEKPSLQAMGNVWYLLIYLSLIAGALSQFLQNRFQRDVEPALASLLMSFESVFGALFGWVFLHQVLSLKELIGCALIFVGILLAE